MKRKITTVLFGVLFLIGFGILIYPTVSDQWNIYRQNKLLSRYEQVLGNMEPEDYTEEWERAKAYNDALPQNYIHSDVFSVEGEATIETEYLKVLNVTQDMETGGIMGSIEIPDINLYLPIYHGTSSEVLKKGIGHLEGTSVPIGGKSTHAIITGHRGLPQAELFTDLDQIEIGDVFYIHVLRETLAYKVYDIEVVKPDETEHLAIEKGRDLVTLLTCTPYGINSHRLLLHGERTEYTEDSTAVSTEDRPVNQWQRLMNQKSFLIAAGIVILVILYGVFRLIKRCMKKCRSKKEEADL